MTLNLLKIFEYMNAKKNSHLTKTPISGLTCSNCLVRATCPSPNKADEAIEELSAIIERNKSTVQKGAIIYQAGDEFKNLYAIRSGSVKIYSINEQGDEQITSFHMSGDLIGFDAIADNEHLSFAQSLETTSISEIPFTEIMHLAAQKPCLNLHLLKLISTEISTKKNLMMMISKQTAEQRLTSFLLHLYENLARRNLAGQEIKLTMTRYEIGNYISLTVETISRLLTKLRKEQIIEVHGRYISILDIDKLHRILQGNLL